MDSLVDSKVLIGASSCLLGQAVRFNGGHKKDRYIVQTLGEHFEFRPFCPEVAIGLGIPRPTIRLVRESEGQPIQAVQSDDASKNHTQALTEYAESVIEEMRPLSGYILKKDSPSCGMERVKVYPLDKPKSPPEKDGVGLFARVIREHFPELPIEEEGRLHDPILRENFIERVFVYKRWQEMVASGLTPAKLVAFHASHKYNIMAHNQATLKSLGQMVATAGNCDDLGVLGSQYIQALMAALTQRIGRGQHANVLQHLMGYFSKEIDAGDKAELLNAILDYKKGLLPLIVPLTLLNHYFRKFPNPYIEQQYYLKPHPKELMLRNQL